ncbi:17079_t:CDS:2, partial [Acaulospora morrowiae]
MNASQLQNMQLLDQLLKFTDILSSAKTSSVSQWNVECLQNAIQCAMNVENEMFMIPEEEIKRVYQQLVLRAKTQPPDIPEFGSAHHLLYGTLLKNVYLSSELFSYIMSTYEFPLEGLFSKKDNISEDVQIFARPLATSEILIGIESSFRSNMLHIKCRSTGNQNKRSRLNDDTQSNCGKLS